MDGLLTVTLTAADLIISALMAGISNSNTATPLYCPDVLRNETFDTFSLSFVFSIISPPLTYDALCVHVIGSSVSSACTVKVPIADKVIANTTIRLVIFFIIIAPSSKTKLFYGYILSLNTAI